MPKKNQWYVITGGPSTGKTTLLLELEKLGHKVIHEAARTIIDEALEQGISVEKLRSNEKRFQDDVARLKQKIEAAHDATMLTFFDRGMHDTLAYMRYYGFAAEKWIENLMQAASYKKVFLLEPLATYQHDYARTETEDFTKRLHKLLHNAYADFGMKPVPVPALNVDDRVKFVLNQIEMEPNA